MNTVVNDDANPDFLGEREFWAGLEVERILPSSIIAERDTSSSPRRSSVFCAPQTEIERFAFGYWVCAYNGKNMIVVLSGYAAYFDASRDQDKTEEIVAGYVSTLEEWAQFEISWRLTLAKYDVEYFKMSEFIGRRKGHAICSSKMAV